MEDQDEESIDFNEEVSHKKVSINGRDIEGLGDNNRDIGSEEEQEAELTIDLYQTHNEIIIQTMIAGVHPDNLAINITRDSITIRGKREENQSINKENYFHSKFLYNQNFDC